jgi:SAM-dependent methyltransferase
MSYSTHAPSDLERIYRNRFAGKDSYRAGVWKILAKYFSRWIEPDGAILDLGSGYCEFINASAAGTKYAMDLNPEVANRVAPGIKVLQQDCSETWALGPESLDAVFTSNFFEHLPTKQHLERTLLEALRALKGGGRLIALGPNIKYLAGAYWDFFDHYVPLTDLSLIEVLKKCGFEIEFSADRFLPYTMSDGRQYPGWVLRTYLALPAAWTIFGKQFLIVARKPCN